MESYADNYSKYRGKCQEMCERLTALDPTLTMVRGHYYEPLWDSDEPHWWCVNSDGEIIDPTSKQFPSGGVKEFYTPFSGVCTCENCGCEFDESDGIPMGNYIVCSIRCARSLVGV